MNITLTSAALAALLLTSFDGLLAQKTIYVRKYPATSSPDGSSSKPYNTLADVEKNSGAGDTIMVMASDEAQGPLDGGIKLQAGQKLLGMGSKVTTVPPPKTRAWITNTTTNYIGDAVVLADNNEVAGIHMSGTRRCAVVGTNVAGANLHDLLVTTWNTSGSMASRHLFGNLYPVGGVFFFMLGTHTTTKSNQCVDCVFDNGPSDAVLVDSHNQSKSATLVRGCRVLSNGATAFELYAFGTSEAKLTVENCSVDNVANLKRGVGAWGEDTPRAELQVDGLDFRSTNQLLPLRGVEMTFNGGATLVCRVVNSTIRDTIDHALLALSYRNATNAKATLDFHAEDNTVTNVGRGISCGAWDSGDLTKLRANIVNNVIETTTVPALGGGIECFCGLNASTIDDAAWTVTGNTLRGGSDQGLIYYNEGGIAKVAFTATNNTISGVVTGLAVTQTAPAPTGPLFVANNMVSGCSADGIAVSGAAPTFVGNTSVGNGAYGLNVSGATVAFANGILWGNTSGGVTVGSGSSPTVTYSAVQGGYTGTGNIKTDPLFIDAGKGDYHLRYDSPCKDKGSNAAVPATLKTDFEGDDRIADKTVDMGADEFFAHLYYTGALTPGGTMKVNVLGDPNSPVGYGISGATGAYDPGVKIPGLAGLLYLKDPIILVPMNKTATTGHSSLTISIPANFPTGMAWTQAIVGLRLTNLSVATVR